MTKEITQEDIARAVGFDASTVNRVLCRAGDKWKHTADTKRKILKTAKEMGYQHLGLVDSHSRIHNRIPWKAKTEVTIECNGEVLTSGQAEVSEISLSGLRITNFENNDQVIPANGNYRIRFLDTALENLELTARPIRLLYDEETDDFYGLALQLTYLSPESLSRLRKVFPKTDNIQN